MYTGGFLLRPPADGSVSRTTWRPTAGLTRFLPTLLSPLSSSSKSFFPCSSFVSSTALLLYLLSPLHPTRPPPLPPTTLLLHLFSSRSSLLHSSSLGLLLLPPQPPLLPPPFRASSCEGLAGETSGGGVCLMRSRPPGSPRHSGAD